MAYVPRNLVCLKAPHCQLCQFLLEDGERVLVVIGIGRVLEIPSFSISGYHRDDRVPGFEVYTNPGGSEFQVDGFHYNCYHFRLSEFTYGLPRRLAFTEYRERPPADHDTLRRRYIAHALSPKLGSSFLKGLPGEICHMVADLLVRESAIVSFQEIATVSAPPVHKVDLSSDIYAQFVKIEGVGYIQALSNEQSTNAKGQVRVFKTRRRRAVQSVYSRMRVVPNVYFRRDHFGFRSVWFTLPGDELSRSLEAKGVWWTKASCDEGFQQVTATTDGLKVIQFLCTSPSEIVPSGFSPSWPVPEPGCTIINLRECQPARENDCHLRMNAMDCNQPGIEGYCAAFHVQTLQVLCAHYSSNTTSLDQELSTSNAREMMYMRYLYMPIDQDEYIKEIWAVQYPGSPLIDSTGLMFVTNLERTSLFGEWNTEDDPRLVRIFAADNSPSRIYLSNHGPDETLRYIRYLGVPTVQVDPSVHQHPDSQDCRHQYPASLIPDESSPLHFDRWFYTHCRLENVMEITYCMTKDRHNNPIIIGMLLRYENGRRACVGQYRPDWAGSPLRVDPRGSLWVGQGSYHVEQVCFEAPAQRGSMLWTEIPLRGRLEWMVTYVGRNCLYHYE